jgi:hypothetical protein
MDEWGLCPQTPGVFRFGRGLRSSAGQTHPTNASPLGYQLLMLNGVILSASGVRTTDFHYLSQSGLGITPSLVSERTGLRTRRPRDSALKGSNNPQGADSCDTMTHSWANASRVTQSCKTVRSISGPETARIDRISRRCLSERPSR